MLYPGYQTLPKKKLRFSFLGESGTQGTRVEMLEKLARISPTFQSILMA